MPTPPAPPAPPMEAEAPAPPLVAGLDTVRAGRFDNGRMWTFENPPSDYLRQSYGIDADSVWFRRARLGALRIPGCSASFVSGDGLVLTNHHCAREHISAVSREGESLLDDGFYAESLDEERAIEEFEADRLIAIRDVTAEMDAALEGINEPQARSQARESAEEEIAARISEEFGGEDAGFEVEMVSLYNGGRTSAYIFRRYTDVRMVMAPELSVGYFGGDPDNFTYPRYALDFSFLRVYEDGDPLDTSGNFFRWSETGVESGDAVFMIGNPGSTSRIQTVAELEFRRDVSDKGLLAFVNNRIDALEAFYDMDPEAGEAMDLRNTIFSLINTQEAYGGILRGLHDPVILAKRRDQERAFQEALEADPELAEEYGGLIAQMAELQDRKAEVAGGFGSFLAFASADYESAVLSRALFAFQYANGSRGGAPAEALEGVMESLREVPDQPRALQELLLAARLRDIAASYGADSPLGKQRARRTEPGGCRRLGGGRERAVGLGAGSRRRPGRRRGNGRPGDAVVRHPHLRHRPLPAGARAHLRRGGADRGGAGAGALRGLRDRCPARRHLLAPHLRRRGVRVRVQRHLRPRGDHLLRPLRPALLPRGGRDRGRGVGPARALARSARRPRPGHADELRLHQRHHRREFGLAPRQRGPGAGGAGLRQQHRGPFGRIHLPDRPRARAYPWTCAASWRRSRRSTWRSASWRSCEAGAEEGLEPELGM